MLLYVLYPFHTEVKNTKEENRIELFFLLINDKLCLLLSLIDRNKFDSILFLRILYLSVKLA